MNSVRFIMTLEILVYTYLLHFSYKNIISPDYSYMGYIYINPQHNTTIILIFLIMIPCIFMPLSFKVVSDLCVWLLYLFVYIPILLVANYQGIAISGSLYLIFGMLCFCLMLLAGIRYIPLMNISTPKVNTKSLKVLFAIITIFFLILIFKTSGFHLVAPVESEEIYGTRLAFREKVTPLVGYLIQWVPKLFNPLIFIYGLVKKKKNLLILGIVLQYFIYTTNGLKSTMFSLILISLIYWCISKKREYFGIRIILVMILIISASLVVDLYLGDGVLTNTFTRRMIMTPGLLSYYYFDFFSNHSPALLSYSMFSNFIPPVYNIAPPYIIGLEYFNRPDMAANANMFADAFANFGAIGILIYTIISIGIFWVYNSVARNKITIATLAIVMPVWCLVDTSFTTTLLTGGLLLAVIIMYFHPEDLKRRKSES